MPNCTSYKDLGKCASDILNKDFGTGKHTCEVKSKVQDGQVTFTGNGSLKPTDGNTDAAFSTECKVMPGMLVKGKMDTCGVTSTTIEAENMFMKGLKVTCDASTPDIKGTNLIQSTAFGLDYKSAALTASCNYDIIKATGSCAAAFPLPYNLTGGVTAAYAKGTLKSFGLTKAGCFGGVGMTGSFIGSLKGVEKANFLACYKYSPTVTVAANACVPLGEGSPCMSIGCSAALDKNTTAKVKVDGCGMLGLSYKVKPNSFTTLTLAAGAALNQDFKKTKHGIALNIAL